jgi:hypothetical protein
MAIREVRSPNSNERSGPRDPGRVGVSPLSAPRADQGHLSRHTGKGITPSGSPVLRDGSGNVTVAGQPPGPLAGQRPDRR